MPQFEQFTAAQTFQTHTETPVGASVHTDKPQRTTSHEQRSPSPQSAEENKARKPPHDRMQIDTQLKTFLRRTG